MPNDYFPAPDRDYAAWLENFAAAASAYQDILHLSDSNIDDIEDVFNQLQYHIEQRDAALYALQGWTQGKILARQTSENTVRRLVRGIQGIAGVPPDIKARLGITPERKKPSHTAPLMPIHVVVKAASNGVHQIKWDTNGNKPKTLYIVEMQSDTQPAWTVIGAGTASRFDHENQIPGVHIAYRVRAQRGKLVSSPSDSASVYERTENNAVLRAA